MDPLLESRPDPRKEKKLLEQMHDVMRPKYYSFRTAQSLLRLGRDNAPCYCAFKTWMKASCGILILPMLFIRFFPSFCFSSSLRLRVMSPP